MISDKNQYNLFLQGDINAFEELVLKYRHNLVYFIMQYIKNYHVSEDIAQEVFAYIYVNPDAYKDTYEFKTFLFLLGKRRAIDYLRSESRHHLISIDEVDFLMDIKSLDEIIDQKVDAIIVRKALNEMKTEYRKVLILIYFNELTIAETAIILGKSIASVKVLAHRAKKKLKQILEKGGITYEI
jgi:RNA polymerase sigma factor (sigma-70 family)